MKAINSSIKRRLKETAFFSKFNDELLDLLFKNSKIIDFPAQSLLFYEGEEGDSFYILLDGIVKIFKTGRNGKEITVKILEKNDIFAEVILFDSNTYPVSAQSLTKSCVLQIGKTKFLELLDNKDFALSFMASTTLKLRYLTNKISYLTSTDLEERFFSFLEERYGKQNEYVIDIPKKEIASSCGTIPETLSRLIKKLHQRDIIKWDGNKIKIL